MSTIFTYTSNSTLILTSSVSAAITCIGAGGHGSSTGTAGSGGAFASITKSLQSGSYQVVVGLATSTDGGDSYVTSASVVICRAPGGKQDGTITHQEALLTGSITGYGGHGCPDFRGYASYNGSGGGEAGVGVGTRNGADGQSAFFSTREAPASGGSSVGVNGVLGTGAGGVGAFYYAGANVNQVFPAGGGVFPGGGGGGSYDYGTNNSGTGANGIVYIAY